MTKTEYLSLHMNDRISYQSADGTRRGIVIGWDNHEGILVKLSPTLEEVASDRDPIPRYFHRTTVEKV